LLSRTKYAFKRFHKTPYTLTTCSKGTLRIFHDSHLSLWKWFITVAILCEAKKGMSACQIQRTVGMSYKTAWYRCHRIRAAMVETDRPKLGGQIEMDETYVGGKGHGLEHRGRGTRKRPVIGIRQRNGELRLFHAKEVTGRVLEKFLGDNVGEDVRSFESHIREGSTRQSPTIGQCRI
jgi:hypothetical protein